MCYRALNRALPRAGQFPMATRVVRGCADVAAWLSDGFVHGDSPSPPTYSHTRHPPPPLHAIHIGTLIRKRVAHQACTSAVTQHWQVSVALRRKFQATCASCVQVRVTVFSRGSTRTATPCHAMPRNAELRFLWLNCIITFFAVWGLCCRLANKFTPATTTRCQLFECGYPKLAQFHVGCVRSVTLSAWHPLLEK